MIKQYSDIDKHVQAQELDHQIQEFLAKGGVIKQCEHKRLTEHQTVMQDEFVAMNSSLPMTTAKGCGYKVRGKK